MHANRSRENENPPPQSNRVFRARRRNPHKHNKPCHPEDAHFERLKDPWNPSHHEWRKMDHLGTAAPAVRRPRCIGPQALVFGCMLNRSRENENALPQSNRVFRARRRNPHKHNKPCHPEGARTSRA